MIHHYLKPNRHEITEEVGNYKFNQENFMSSKFGRLDGTDIKSALVLAGLTAAGAGLAYIIGLGDLFLIQFKPLVNVVGISLAVGLLSIIQSALTTKQGNFIGAVKVKDVY